MRDFNQEVSYSLLSLSGEPVEFVKSFEIGRRRSLILGAKFLFDRNHDVVTQYNPQVVL